MASLKEDVFWEIPCNLGISGIMRTPANLRYPKYTDDQKLGLRYKSAMQRIMRETDK